MKNNRRLLLGIIVVALAACDFDISSFDGGKQPKIYFGSGITLLVADNETAKVYGYDQCPKNNELLFGPSIDDTGCTLLTGKKAVNVKLKLADGALLDETWAVKEGVGKNGKGIQVIRPNGWVLRKPES